MSTPITASVVLLDSVSRLLLLLLTAASPRRLAGWGSSRSIPLADDQHELALQVAAFADAVRLGGLGERKAGDRRRPDRALVVKLVHALEMGAVARDARAQHLDIRTRRLKPLRRRRDPDETAARL